MFFVFLFNFLNDLLFSFDGHSLGWCQFHGLCHLTLFQLLRIWIVLVDAYAVCWLQLSKLWLFLGIVIFWYWFKHHASTWDSCSFYRVDHFFLDLEKDILEELFLLENLSSRSFGWLNQFGISDFNSNFHGFDNLLDWVAIFLSGIKQH